MLSISKKNSGSFPEDTPTAICSSAINVKLTGSILKPVSLNHSKWYAFPMHDAQK